MKKIFSFLLCLISIVSFWNFEANSIHTADEIINNSVSLELISKENVLLSENNTRASGLIYSYALSLSKNGTTLNIGGLTNCTIDVVKCGFKDLTVQRRKTTSDSWSDYYEYGDLYVERTTASLAKTLVVPAGYQYRMYCKHYAKKSLFVTQSISNTSNIVTVS